MVKYKTFYTEMLSPLNEVSNCIKMVALKVSKKERNTEMHRDENRKRFSNSVTLRVPLFTGDY